MIQLLFGLLYFLVSLATAQIDIQLQANWENPPFELQVL